MGLAHTRAGPGGAIARSGGKVVVLCYPLLVLPASAVLLDLSISLLGYEALVCWICVSAGVPAGARGEPGVEKIRHYRNADGKLPYERFGTHEISGVP